MTPDELELQRRRIKAAEVLGSKIGNMEGFCQVVEAEINNLGSFSLAFYEKDGEESVVFNEWDAEVVKEFAKLAMDFAKKKIAARKVEYSKI